MRAMLLLTVGSVLLFNACSSSAPARRIEASYDVNAVIQTARRQLGVRYRYGGHSPARGFDCSGLVYYTYSKAGLSLPRSTHSLYRMTEPVNRSQLKKGDLLFFRIYRKISHVGIYIGNNRFIHAPSSGKAVMMSSLDNPYWNKHFIQGGRLN